jgi:hypothetical protein
MKHVKQNNETPSFSVPFVDFALGVAALGDEVEEGLELALGDDVEPGDEAGDEEGDDEGADEGAADGVVGGNGGDSGMNINSQNYN